MTKSEHNHPFIGCTPVSLPGELADEAAQRAIEINPANRPDIDALAQLLPSSMPMTNFIAVMTGKVWHTNGVNLTVGFMDNPPNDLRAKILSHMNAWGKTANVVFRESPLGDAKVRISRENVWPAPSQVA